MRLAKTSEMTFSFQLLLREHPDLDDSSDITSQLDADEARGLLVDLVFQL